MDTIGHYSVPITRRVGSIESEIPEKYRGRTHMTNKNHVRCGLFAGDNIIQVTWNGPDEATLQNMQENNTNLTIVGTVPAGGCVHAHSMSQPPATRITSGSHSARPHPRWAPTGVQSQSPDWEPSAPKGGGINGHHRGCDLPHRETRRYRRLQAIRLGYPSDHPSRRVSDYHHVGWGCQPPHLRRGWGGHAGEDRFQWQDAPVRVPRPILPSDPSHKHQPGGPQPGTGCTNHHHLTQQGVAA